MRLQLCKYVYNCTFCVERHTKKFKSPASDPFPWIRQFKSWRSIRTQKRFPKFLNIGKLYVGLYRTRHCIRLAVYRRTECVLYRLPNWTYPSHPTYLPPEPSITRNLSADEIANVNFLYDDIVHVLQNTIDSCIPPQIDAAVMCGTYVYQIQ